MHAASRFLFFGGFQEEGISLHAGLSSGISWSLCVQRRRRVAAAQGAISACVRAAARHSGTHHSPASPRPAASASPPFCSLATPSDSPSTSSPVRTRLSSSLLLPTHPVECVFPEPQSKGSLHHLSPSPSTLSLLLSSVRRPPLNPPTLRNHHLTTRCSASRYRQPATS